jgi:hypothetical protein
MTAFKCPLCKLNYIEEQALYSHIETTHKKEIGKISGQQVYFNWKRRYDLNRQFGKCVMTGKPTKFNKITGKYQRFADEKARMAYREYFRKNMISKYGKDTILDEPEQQKKMLANRSISGIYKWSTGQETTYTGSYERNFLEYLDAYLDWDDPEDIMGPAPMTFPYKNSEGEQKFHIPDFYIGSMNLIVNIKASDNKHYRLRDMDDELAQDHAIKQSNFNYLKLYDNKFDNFLKIIEMIKNQKSGKIVLE